MTEIRLWFCYISIREQDTPYGHKIQQIQQYPNKKISFFWRGRGGGDVKMKIIYNINYDLSAEGNQLEIARLYQKLKSIYYSSLIAMW